MCRRVTCGQCNKYTWAGCGLHIDQALAGLSKDQICTCKDEQKQHKDLNAPSKILVNQETELF